MIGKNFIFLFLVAGFQILGNTYNVLWEGVANEIIAPNISIAKPYFKNAFYFEAKSTVPYFVISQKIPNNRKIKDVKLKYPNYKNSISDYSNIVNQQEVVSSKLEWKIISSRGEKRLEVYVPAFQMSAGSVKQLMSFEIEIESENTISNKELISTKSNITSPFASGNWYKLEVSSDAIYEISYQDLESYGISPSSINPRNIQIWGDGKGILSEEILVNENLSIQEIPIEVTGENDGSFDSNDKIIFFGKGPNDISYDETNEFVNYEINPYDNTSSYFLTIGNTAGERIQSHGSYIADGTVNNRIEIHHQENNTINLIKTGRRYFGDYFDITTSRSYSFNLSSLAAGSSTKFKAVAAVRSFVSTGNQFTLRVNGSTLGSESAPAVPPGYTNIYAQVLTLTEEGNYSGNTNLELQYSKPSASSIAWLDYITINQPTPLTFSSGSYLFFNPIEASSFSISKYQIASSQSIQIWDVTNGAEPKKCLVEFSNNSTSFSLPSDSLKIFVAHNYNDLKRPSFSGKLQNIDLAELIDKKYIVITPSAFLSAAQDLSEFHSITDGYSTGVVKLNDIYNLFGSGKSDITAIRNFIRYLYENSTSTENKLKYVMLMGDGSYDYDRGNYVPTYQSVNSLSPISSFASDDYFGIIEPGEKILNNSKVDIAIGRFPAKSLSEANTFVNKVKEYVKSSSFSTVGEYQIPQNFGDWKNRLFFVADDGNDADNYTSAHLNETELLLNNIELNDSSMNKKKVYMDAYPKEPSAGGGRYPIVEEEIEQEIHNGALVVSYIGHGGEAGWADERILKVSDINNWSNKYKLPLFLTATCEFSRFDDPDRVSAGEYVITNPAGGAIAMLTTVRLVFGGNNNNIGFSNNFFDAIFTPVNGEYGTLGDALLQAKVVSPIGSAYNSRKFALLGDPGIKLGIPELKVTTTAITDFNGAPLDTIRANSRIRITGQVQDLEDNPTNFNGIIYHTVYDKESQKTTLDNNNKGSTTTFGSRENILFKGKSSVSNGQFSFDFIVPKDINYSFGNGKISYYAANTEQDGNGHYFDFIVGGTDSSGNNDNTPPSIELYLNDTSFVNGGLTNDQPLLIAYLEDDFGINTSGAGIGRNITITIDNDYANSIVINDAYEADLNSFNSGSIQHQLSTLSTGEHQLTLKVWDVNNNSTEKTIYFEVKNSEDIKLGRVFNYPNPFTTFTEFHFEHNQYEDNLEVLIKIFTISGKVVKSIKTNVPGNQNLPLNAISWNGKDSFGDTLGNGVYLYEITIRNSNGDTDKKIEKLVLLN